MTGTLAPRSILKRRLYQNTRDTGQASRTQEPWSKADRCHWVSWVEPKVCRIARALQDVAIIPEALPLRHQDLREMGGTTPASRIHRMFFSRPQ